MTPKGREKYLNTGYTKPFSGFPEFSVPRLSLWDRLTSFTSSFFAFSLFRRAKQFVFSAIDLVLTNPLYLLLIIYVNYLIWRWAYSLGYRLMRWLFSTTPTQTPPRVPRRPFWSSFFGGGTDDYPGGPPGPPPPYSRYPRKTFQVTPETQGWRPGFWTGFGTGAAAGYGLGSRRTATQTQEQPQQRMYSQASSSSMGGSGAGVGSVPSGVRQSADEGSGTHTSTGFGGTRRR